MTEVTDARPPRRTVESVWIRLVLGLLFLGMALGQLASWAQLPEIFAAYQLPGLGSPGFAAALIAAELVVGGWLVGRPRSTALTPVWLYLAVALFWSGLGLQAILRGIEVGNCGCFGVYLTQQLSWFVLAQDGLLLLYGYVMVRGARRARRVQSKVPVPVLR